MPRCEGLPGGPCPLRKNDTTVVIGKGDLMLCPSCDAERRRMFEETVRQKSNKAVTRGGSMTTSADGTLQPDSSASCKLSSATTAETMIVTSELLASTSHRKTRTSTKTITDKRTTNTKPVGIKQQNQVVQRDRNDSCDDNFCPSCLESVDVADECVRCDTCKHSFHQVCTGMTCDAFQILITIVDQSYWVCQQCRQDFRNIHSAISRTNEELADLRSSVLKLSQELDILKNTTKNVPSSVSQSLSMEASTSDTNTVPAAVDHTDIAVVVQRTVRDIARRKQNVIISGLPEPTCDSEAENRLADETAFHMLCEENLTVKPAMAPRGCRRLGRYDGHRPRRLLVHLMSESNVSSLLTVARELRQSSERYIAENVYINPDLSPAEAQDAYEKRQRRRATAAARRQSQQQSPDNPSTGTFDTCTESLTTVASASDASTTDNIAAGSHITTSTSSTTISGTTVKTGATNQPFPHQ